MWQLTPLDSILEDRGTLNDVEQVAIKHCPALRRIPTAQRPVMIRGYIPKNHNPDFILLDSIFVELKGYIRDGLYRPMLQEFPQWLRNRYHVLICNSSAREREKMVDFCTTFGISYSEGPELPGWVVIRAIELGPMHKDTSIIWTP